MASIARDKNGTRRVLFVAPDGSRKAIRMGKVSQRAAEKVKGHVERLVVAQFTGNPVEVETARWLTERDARLLDKLACAGLIPKREPQTVLKLGEHLTNFIASRPEVKPRTVINWRQAERSLLDFFGPDRPLASITAGDARDLERWLRTGQARENRYLHRSDDDGLAYNTVRRRLGNVKQFFQDAVNRELLDRNPFAGIRGNAGSNRERDFFVDRVTAAKILTACPDAQWRLLFALSRFAGLRCPSEHLALTWGDVNWAEGRFIVHSSKTEHHEGKATRVVPIFPELLPLLREVFEQAEPGTVHVISRYRNANSNLRTQLERIIRKAGLSPWPKLFQNLRASRATELANEFPAHVAAAWLGHSTLVANKHYWQVTDADFQKAVARAGTDVEVSAEKAAQNPAQSAHETVRNAPQRETTAHKKTLVLSGSSEFAETSENQGYAWAESNCRPTV